MSAATIFGILSTILGIYSTFPYVQAILQKRTKPHQLSWLVYFIMNGIVLFSQYFAGARASILISLTFFIGSFIILLLSFRFGIRTSSKFDWFLFSFAMLTVIIWILTKNNTIAILLTIFIDLCATTMMILKFKSHPDSEDPFPWLIGTLAYIFTCLTLVGQPIGILYVRPLYGLLSMGAIVAFIYYYRGKAKRISG